MALKLAAILLASAAFGWGFSALVEHSDGTIRPNAPHSCQEWTGSGCDTPLDR